MIVRPGPVTPGRHLPAALLVVLVGLASLLGAPAAAADAATVARSTLGGAPATAAPLPLTARHDGTRGAADAAATRRVSRERSALAALPGPADLVSVTRSAPAPAPAVTCASALLALALLGRGRRGRAGWSLSGRTPAGHRGRAPPAYRLA